MLNDFIKIHTLPYIWLQKYISETVPIHLNILNIIFNEHTYYETKPYVLFFNFIIYRLRNNLIVRNYVLQKLILKSNQ